LLAAQEGYGFNGLSVAFIAGCSCVGCIPSSLLFAALIYGGMTVQQVVHAPSEIINIMIGTIVFFTALPGITPHIASWLERRRAKSQTDKTDSTTQEA
jgi:simple sugar transport system permease protein